MKKNHSSFFHLCFLFIALNLSAQVEPLPEKDPHRGMYVNRFLRFQTQTINSGLNVIDVSNSILGVDVGNDGIFEKEDELLTFAKNRHITHLVLYDLYNIIGRGILVWNQSANGGVGETQDLEVHLCRFMAKARNNYCISEFAAAGESIEFFDNLSVTGNLRITPPYQFTPAERNSLAFAQGLDIAEQDNTNSSYKQIAKSNE